LIVIKNRSPELSINVVCFAVHFEHRVEVHVSFEETLGSGLRSAIARNSVDEADAFASADTSASPSERLNLGLEFGCSADVLVEIFCGFDDAVLDRAIGNCLSVLLISAGHHKLIVILLVGADFVELGSGLADRHGLVAANKFGKFSKGDRTDGFIVFQVFLLSLHLRRRVFVADEFD
jgi:hypothetical protein